MATPSSMILRALQMTGEKGIGDSLTTAEQTNYLEVLNSLMASFSLGPLMCYQQLIENFPLTVGVNTYTIGIGGAFNTTRPNKILSAYVRDSTGYDIPVQIINDEAYNNIRLKSVGNTYPAYLNYDNAYVGGLATISLYPKPKASLTLYISSYKQLTQFTTILDNLSLPPGYQRMIETSLALELCVGQVQASKELVAVAKEARALIKRLNSDTPYLKMDNGISGSRSGNIFTG